MRATGSRAASPVRRGHDGVNPAAPLDLTAVFRLGGPGDPQMDPSANLFVYWVLFAPAIVGGLLLAAAGWVKRREA